MKRLEPRSGANSAVFGARTHGKNGSAAAGEKMRREVPRKKTAAARLGKKGARGAASPGKIFQLCRGKKMLCSHSRNRYLIPDVKVITERPM